MSDRESVDFDFFESPKGPSKSEEVSSSGQTKSDHLKEAGKGSEKREKHGSPFTSPSRRSTTPDYSSDSYESDTGSESKQQDVKKKGRLSHSSSASSLSSRSRSGTHRSRSTSASSSRSDSNGGKKSRPSDSHNGRCKTRNSKREDDYSSSAYSDDDNGKPFNSSNSVPKNAKRNAWGESQDKSSERHRSAKTRPMTAKSRPTQRKQQSRKKSDSDSEALSDSDITDVSPMESPRTQEQKKLDIAGLGLVGAAGDGRVGKVRYRAMPVGPGGCDEDNEQHTPRGGLDLEILMEAVGELEKQKRVEANTRRVMFAPMTLKRGDKSNYTFDKDQTRDIERENQRLLKEIVRRVNAGDQLKQFRRPQPSASKLTPSAVNRERDMRRIETENMSILRRLQKVKPTQSISRTNQIKSYENTKLHGIPISTLHPLPKTGKRAASRADDSTSSIGSRTRSLTSLHSVASSVRSTGSRRSSRPNSATKRVDSRPEWTDRW